MIHLGSTEQHSELPVLRAQPAAGGFDASHLGTDGRLSMVVIPEAGGEQDVYVICSSGHPPVASLPLLSRPDVPYCEVCAAIHEGQRRLDMAAVRADRRGFRKLV